MRITPVEALSLHSLPPTPLRSFLQTVPSGSTVLCLCVRGFIVALVLSLFVPHLSFFLSPLEDGAS